MIQTKRKGNILFRFSIYLFGLLFMTLGIVLFLKADLGATPWDVLHVGLFQQLGLTIGTWSILVGLIILTLSSIIMKELPKMGAFLNMLLVGLFIDMYLLVPFMETPSSLLGKGMMFFSGLVIMGYGIGIYISANLGAGPRDSLMIALTNRTGWKVKYIRGTMEIAVLIIGWQLGGPVSYGTFFFGLIIGPIVGITLPQCLKLTNYFIQKLEAKAQIKIQKLPNEMKRGASL